MTINFLFFENYETLDIFGPIEILARIDGVKTNYVSMQGGLAFHRAKSASCRKGISYKSSLKYALITRKTEE